MKSNNDTQSRAQTFAAQDAIQVNHIFRTVPGTLKDLFDPSLPLSGLLEKFGKWKDVQELLKDLSSEADSGIMGDARDLKRRKSFFGKNEKPRAQIPPFKESLRDAMDEKIYLILAICAAISIITGMIAEPKLGWMKGVSIIVATLALIVISSLADWTKDKAFVSLQSLGKDEEQSVVRGKQGAIQTVNIWNLVVGDVIILKEGDRVPADCIVIEASPDFEL